MEKSKTIKHPYNKKSLSIKNSHRVCFLAFVVLFVSSCTNRSLCLCSSGSSHKDDIFSSISENEESDSFDLSSSVDKSESITDSLESTPASTPLYLNPLYAQQIENKMIVLNDLKAQSDEYEVFTFYTDHHCFLPNGSFEVDNDLLESHFELIKYIQDSSDSEFVLFGGDALNNNDTKTQACYKLSLYMEMMDRFFANPLIIVGNHDTNYQGNTYISSNDPESCTLSQETINDVLFNGNNSYYNFDTENTSFYCFDSGVDDFAFNVNNYQHEQLEWFADSLLSDNKAHKAIFIHMAIVRYDGVNRAMTGMMSEIGRIIRAFNERGTVVVNNNSYDYSLANGAVEFIQSGHSHADINNIVCGGVPAVVTTSFASPEAVSIPTFDVAFADYTNHELHLLRIGEGDDRVFDIP